MANKFVLAIDNSIDYLNLALAGEKGLIEELSVKESRSPSEILPQNVEALLRGQGLSMGDVTDLVVTLGPGSFTGIRVALAFCKGIHAATGIPLKGIPTLDALAFSLADREGSYLCPLVDAKKGEVFLSLYRVRRGRLSRLTGYAAMKPQEVPGIIATPCICFGTGTRLCETYLSRRDGVSIVHNEFDQVRGRALVDDRLAAMDPGGPGNFKPIYGRRSEAEIKFNVTID